MTTEIKLFNLKILQKHNNNVKLKLFQIMMMSNNMENVAPHVIKVVARQVQTLAQEKMEGISLMVNEDDMTDIQVNIDTTKCHVHKY